MQVPVFSPRALANLRPVHTLPSLSPLLKVHAEDLRGDGTPQLFALCGRSSRSQPYPVSVSRSALALAHSAEQKRGQSRLRLDKSRSL